MFRFFSHLPTEEPKYVESLLSSIINGPAIFADNFIR